MGREPDHAPGSTGQRYYRDVYALLAWDLSNGRSDERCEREAARNWSPPVRIAVLLVRLGSKAKIGLERAEALGETFLRLVV